LRNPTHLFQLPRREGDSGHVYGWTPTLAKKPGMVEISEDQAQKILSGENWQDVLKQRQLNEAAAKNQASPPRTDQIILSETFFATAERALNRPLSPENRLEIESSAKRFLAGLYLSPQPTLGVLQKQLSVLAKCSEKLADALEKLSPESRILLREWSGATDLSADIGTAIMKLNGLRFAADSAAEQIAGDDVFNLELKPHLIERRAIREWAKDMQYTLRPALFDLPHLFQELKKASDQLLIWREDILLRKPQDVQFLSAKSTAAAVPREKSSDTKAVRARLIRDLAEIYEGIIGRRAAVAWDPIKGVPSGPFFFFCQALFLDLHNEKHLQDELSPEALRRAIQRAIPSSRR